MSRQHVRQDEGTSLDLRRTKVGFQHAGQSGVLLPPFFVSHSVLVNPRSSIPDRQSLIANR
jgi:hypothetical protein